jgi:hypothetical protein
MGGDKPTGYSRCCCTEIVHYGAFKRISFSTASGMAPPALARLHRRCALPDAGCTPPSLLSCPAQMPNANARCSTGICTSHPSIHPSIHFSLHSRITSCFARLLALAYFASLPHTFPSTPAPHIPPSNQPAHLSPSPPPRTRTPAALSDVSPRNCRRRPDSSRVLRLRGPCALRAGFSVLPASLSLRSTVPSRCLPEWGAIARRGLGGFELGAGIWHVRDGLWQEGEGGRRCGRVVLGV